MGSSDDDWEGLSDDEIEAFLSGSFSSGAPIREDEIDEVLYNEAMVTGDEVTD